MKISILAITVAIAIMFAGCDALEDDQYKAYSPIYEKMGSQEVAEFGTVQYTVGKIVKTSECHRHFGTNLRLETERLSSDAPQH